MGLLGSASVASLIFAQGKLYLLTDKVESGRLLAEEFRPSGAELIEFEWYRKSEEAASVERLFGPDLATDGELEPLIMPLRAALDERELATMRKLGKAVAEAVEEGCFKCEPGMSEHEIAGLMAGKAFSLGVECNVVLAAADERISLYRHPMPTGRRLERLAMLSLVGRKDGLFAGLTRFVHFGGKDEGLLSKQAILNRIFARLVSRTRPGADLKDVFADLAADYEAEGYRDEWKSLHQGGPIGYSARELKASPGLSFKVEQGQAYAWNPTLAGFKVEDTVIIGMASNEIITATDRIPKMEVGMPGAELAVSDILYR